MITLSISKFRTSLFAAALTLSALPSISHAQSPDFRDRVNVPFAFQVGARHFTPGVYTIDMETDHLLAIHSRSNTAQSMTMWETSSKPATNSKVIFHKYGNRYFLAEVWKREDADHLKCFQSSAERRAQKSEQPRNAEQASSHPNGTEVEVALLETTR